MQKERETKVLKAFRLNKNDVEKLQQIADSNDLTLSYIVSKAIKEYLAKQSKDLIIEKDSI